MPHYLSLMHLASFYLTSCCFFFRTIMLYYLLVTMEWSPCHWQRASDWPGAGLIDCGCLPGNISEEHASRCSSTTHTYVNTPCLTFGCDEVSQSSSFFSSFWSRRRKGRRENRQRRQTVVWTVSFHLC